MEDFSISSISNTISKGSIFEEISMVQANMEDAASQLVDGINPEAISNELIREGDEILETYQVTSNAIHGGMGSVWRVRHKNWGVDLAMKRPQPKFFAEGSKHRKNEFVAECENWINLGLHPNIVSCYYVRDISGVPSIFAEWMDNGSLKDRIRDGSLYKGTEEEVQERILDIAIQTAQGLRYSHEKGLIHQDVKPGNILLTKEWVAKVADFGLAKAASQLSDGDRPFSTGYTLEYCPKEQAEGTLAEAWMDVYAWALTVLEMYAGKRLWKTGEEAAVTYENCFAESKVEIPVQMKHLIKECITGKYKKNADSFQSVFSQLSDIRMEQKGESLLVAQELGTDLVSSVNLNNYALSMIDMGKEEQASRLFESSLQIMPDNLFARINSVFFRMQRNEISYKEALEYFQNLPDSEEKSEAIRTLIAVNSGLMEIRILRECSDPMQACFDAEGRVWITSDLSSIRNHEYGQLYCFDANTGDRLYDDTKLSWGYSALVIDNESQYLYAARRVLRLYNHHYTNYIYRLNIHNVTEWENLDFEGEEYDAFLNYRNQYIGYGAIYSGRCLDLRFEPGGILRSLEKLEWVTQEDDYFYTFSAVRFKLLPNGALEFIERIHLGDEIPSEDLNSCQKHLKGSIQNDKEDPEILAVNSSGSRIVRKSPIGIHGKDECYSPTLYRPGQGTDNYVYHIGRFADVKAIIQLADQTKDLEEKFNRAVDLDDYEEAILLFETYRNLPEQRDSETTQKMERVLAKVCKRTSLDHCIEVKNIDFVPDCKPFYDRISIKHYEKFQSGQSEKLFKAFHKSVKKFPIRLEYASGEDRTVGKDCLSIKAFCLEKDEKYAYIDFHKQGIAKLDLSDSSLKGIAIYPCLGFSGMGNIQISPDANRFAVQGSYGGVVYLIYDNEHAHGFNLAGKDDGNHTEKGLFMTDGAFTPDSRLFIWKDLNEDKHYMSSFETGAKRIEAFDSTQIRADISFSRDGFLLRLEDQKTGEPLKYFRLSYNYEFDGFKEWDPDAGIFLRQYLSEQSYSLEQNLDNLMEELSFRGFGNLKKESVRKALEDIAGKVSKHKEPDSPQKGFFKKLFG